MTLLHSWKDSLSIFKPSNFKLFILVTLKSLGMTYKVWLKYWWWLVVALCVVMSSPSTIGLGPVYQNGTPYSGVVTFPGFIIYSLIVILILLLIYSTLFLSTRASMQLKTLSYFRGYWKHILYIFPLFSALLFAKYVFFMYGFFTYYYSNYKALIFLALFTVISWLVCSMLLFFTLFFFDTPGSLVDFFKSVGRGFKMTLYNLPGCVVLGFLILGVFLWVLAFVKIVVINLLIAPLMHDYNYYNLIRILVYFICELLLFLPILANLVTNFYIKRVHEQFNLYYGK